MKGLISYFLCSTTYLYVIRVSLLTYLVFADLRLPVEYRNMNEETSKQWSDRHVAIGNAVLTADKVSNEQNVGREGQCIASALENLREGISIA